jgi:transposase
MFIVTVTKKNKGSTKAFEYQHLVESIRTEKGPRQRFLLNLGKLELPKEEWLVLAKRIDEILHGQETLFSPKPEIEQLAGQYAQAIIRKYEAEYDDTPRDYQTVDIHSLEKSQERSIGAEYIAYSFLKKLELEECLFDLSFSKREREAAILLIVGRMVHPGSEKRTHLWAQHISGLDELLGTSFKRLSHNTLYKVSDKLLKNKESIESHLRKKERDLFGLKEKIILYDLTNTFFEGRALGNSKARFGVSKEKRSDCRLLTLGLVVDGKGFPKTSRVFSGNQSEPRTLLEMVESLREASSDFSDGQGQIKMEQPTIVIDAGIASEANLRELRQRQYHYVCVSRKKPDRSDDNDNRVEIKDKPGHKIEVRRTLQGGEVFLYCRSEAKGRKEKSMQSRMEQHFEEELTRIVQSIHKKGGIKNYQKVCERIGRLREKYPRIAHYYAIAVEEKNGFADKITWQYEKKQESDQRFSGTYYLRTDRTDLLERQIWEIYIMLKELEDAFRSMKGEMGLRPNYHQKENRSDGHIFITVLAYHVLNSIQHILKQNDQNNSWETIRILLSTHRIGSVKLLTNIGKTIHVRKCSTPEAFHQLIYNALKLDFVPVKPKKLES